MIMFLSLKRRHDVLRIEYDHHYHLLEVGVAKNCMLVFIFKLLLFFLFGSLVEYCKTIMREPVICKSSNMTVRAADVFEFHRFFGFCCSI